MLLVISLLLSFLPQNIPVHGRMYGNQSLNPLQISSGFYIVSEGSVWHMGCPQPSCPEGTLEGMKQVMHWHSRTSEQRGFTMQLCSSCQDLIWYLLG